MSAEATEPFAAERRARIMASNEERSATGASRVSLVHAGTTTVTSLTAAESMVADAVDGLEGPSVRHHRRGFVAVTWSAASVSATSLMRRMSLPMSVLRAWSRRKLCTYVSRRRSNDS
jgi:hypothetical protein